MRFWYLLPALLPILTACPPPDTNTITLDATELHWTWGDLEQYNNPPWCDPPVVGVTPGFTNGPDDIPVGYRDFFDPGSGAFACWDKIEYLLRGRAVFDLSAFDAISAATLQFDVTRSVIVNSEVTNQIPPACNATVLGMATENRSFKFDNASPLPTCASPTYTFGVLSKVQSWIDHTHPNFGFVLAGPRLEFPSDLPEDNEARVSWYGHFHLVVTYVPALNPRAPQGQAPVLR
jgi:hypothetical protein